MWANRLQRSRLLKLLHTFSIRSRRRKLHPPPLHVHVHRARPTPSLHRDTRSCTYRCSVSRKTDVLTTLISKTSFRWWYLKCLATPRCASSCRLEYFKPDSNRTVNKRVSNFQRFSVPPIKRYFCEQIESNPPKRNRTR